MISLVVSTKILYPVSYVEQNCCYVSFISCVLHSTPILWSLQRYEQFQEQTFSLGTETSQVAVGCLKMYHMLYIFSSWHSKHGLNKDKTASQITLVFSLLLSFAFLHYIVNKVHLLTILFIHQRV